MSVTNTPRKAGPYTGNNTDVQYTFGFKVFADSDLVVTRAVIATGTESTLVLTTDYSVTRNADQDVDPGGYITLTAALADTYTLTLTSAVPDTQPAVFTNLGGFFPAVLNNALDRLTILVQQVKETVGRALKVAVSTPAGFDATLPAPVPYAGIAFNADGTGFTTFGAEAGTASALAGDLAAGDGAALVGLTQSGTGAVARTVQDKLHEFVSAGDFGAAADGVADDAAELNSALSSGAPVVRLSGTYLIGANVTVPNGVDVLAEPGTTITSNGSGNFVVSGSNTIENVAFAFGSSARRVVGDGVSNVTFRNCSATGSTGNGFDLYNGPSDILFENCKAYSNGGYGIAVLGSVATAPTRINIRGCRTYSNSYDGICVAGVGQKTSPVQAANYATNVVISGCMSYSNGSGGAFNGITTPYCRYVTVADCLTYSNQEHGIALQETFDFAIANPVSHSNGQAGISMQSGYDPFNPTARGTVIGAHCYANSNEGLALKEQVQYVIFTGCNFTGNTQYSVRLRDLGGSGLYSSHITFVGCAFNPSGGAGFTNSNSSQYITSGAAYNYAGAPLQPNQAVTAALSTATTIDSRGATFNYPEVFVLTDSGTQVSRTAIAQATLGRRIVLMADASGAVAVRHNQGDGVTYAGFVNSAAATVTLGAWKSITYTGNGTDWIETAKNT